MPKKQTPEDKLKKLQLDKMAVKEALGEFLSKEFSDFKGKLGGWVINCILVLIFMAMLRAFFYGVERGWIKLEDIGFK